MRRTLSFMDFSSLGEDGDGLIVKHGMRQSLEAVSSYKRTEDSVQSCPDPMLY